MVTLRAIVITALLLLGPLATFIISTNTTVISVHHPDATTTGHDEQQHDEQNDDDELRRRMNTFSYDYLHHELPVVYPDSCHRATGPRDLRPAPPLSVSLHPPPLSSLSVEPPPPPPAVHIYIKGSSAPKYISRAKWIAQTWAKEVSAPHTVTFVLDTQNETAAAVLQQILQHQQQHHQQQKQGRVDDAGIGDGVSGGGRGGTNGVGGGHDGVNNSSSIKLARYYNNNNKRAVVVEGIDAFGNYQRNIPSRGKKKRSKKEKRKRAKQEAASLSAGYAAQRAKQRWVLSQPIPPILPPPPSFSPTSLSPRQSDGSGGWVCYLDDDLVVNITNLVRDLTAKHPLCAPDCYIGAVKKFEGMGGAGNVKNDTTFYWTTGGWCFEAALVRRLQRDYIGLHDGNKTDPNHHGDQADADADAEQQKQKQRRRHHHQLHQLEIVDQEKIDALEGGHVGGYTGGGGWPDDLGLGRLLKYHFNVQPLGSSRWMIGQRAATTPPTWFHASRRDLYAVYHQVDVETGCLRRRRSRRRPQQTQQPRLSLSATGTGTGTSPSSGPAPDAAVVGMESESVAVSSVSTAGRTSPMVDFETAEEMEDRDTTTTIVLLNNITYSIRFWEQNSKAQYYYQQQQEQQQEREIRQQKQSKKMMGWRNSTAHEEGNSSSGGLAEPEPHDEHQHHQLRLLPPLCPFDEEEVEGVVTEPLPQYPSVVAVNMRCPPVDDVNVQFFRDRLNRLSKRRY